MQISPSSTALRLLCNMQLRTVSLTHLGSTVCSLQHTEANKGGVGHFHQDVVYTVHVDLLDAASLHVHDDPLVPQRSVQTPVPI